MSDPPILSSSRPAAARTRLRLTSVTERSEPIPVGIAYNGSDRGARKPSIRPSSHPLLRTLPEGTLIEAELRLKNGDDAPIVCDARRNSHYYFLRNVRLPANWPDPPNDTDYEIRFRVIGYDDPADPRKLHRLPERPDRGELVEVAEAAQ